MLFLSMKLIIWLYINFSVSLENTGSKLIGRYWFREAGSPDLWIGITLAIFIFAGTIPELKDKFTICVNGSAMSSIICNNNLFEILSYPELNLGFSVLAVFIKLFGSIGFINMLFWTFLVK